MSTKSRARRIIVRRKLVLSTFLIFQSIQAFTVRRREPYRETSPEFRQREPATSLRTFSECRPMRLFAVDTSTSLPAFNASGANPQTTDALEDVNSTFVIHGDEALAAQVREWRQRAKELYAEAALLEQSLRKKKDSLQARRKQEKELLTSVLFDDNRRPLTADAMARTLREDRWSPDQVLLVLETLYERQQKTSTGPSANNVTKTTNADGGRPTASVESSYSNETEQYLLSNALNCLVLAAEQLDVEAADPRMRVNARWQGRVASSLRSRLAEMQRNDAQAHARKLEAQLQVAISNKNETIQDFMRRSMGLPTLASSNTGATASPGKVGPMRGGPFDTTDSALNLTRVAEKIPTIPLWLPTSLLRYILATNPEHKLDPQDVQGLRDRVLAGSRFYVTSMNAMPSAAIYRGNLRNAGGLVIDAAVLKQDRELTARILEEIQYRMDGDREKIGKRVQIFFLQDPEWRPGRDGRETAPKPVVLAIPKTVVPDDRLLATEATPPLVRALRRASVPVTLLTTFFYAFGGYALNPRFFDRIANQRDLRALTACTPVILGVLAVQGVHEVVQRWVARKRHISLGRPTPLPSGLLGTYGCMTSLRSFPANRASMLDLAISGPTAAMAISILCMIVGIRATVRASALSIGTFPVVPVSILKSSFLTGTLLTYLAPKVIALPLSQPIPIHPLLLIGFSGLMASAVNMLPIFRLDGGRAASAALGNRFNAISSAATLSFMLSLAVSGGSDLAIGWGILVVLCQRRTEIPLRDEVTDVDDVRKGGWIASLATAIMALVPFPGGNGFL